MTPRTSEIVADIDEVSQISLQAVHESPLGAHMHGKVDKAARVRSAVKPHEGWPIYDVWNKYEKIAMHFNDLLIRLRTQALAGVAALSTFVTIFAKYDVANLQGSWHIAAGVFFALCLFWIAIWVIDFTYYNRLLIGAVAAILHIEELSKTQTHVMSIQMSTLIEASVAGSLASRNPPHSKKERRNLKLGTWTFYSLVLFALLCGLSFSLFKCISPQSCLHCLLFQSVQY